MKGSIKVSEKHGVNPAIPKCFYCNKDKNMLILAGRLPGDREAPKGAVWDMEPCDDCKALMKIGIMLVSVRVGESGDNPYRTGKMCVIKEEALRRMLDDGPLVGQIVKRRFTFVPDDAWEKLGLPTEDFDNRG